MIILIAWELWCEQNVKIFRHVASTPATIIAKITAGALKITELITA
jgi:DNA-binding transcriptional regulator YdaS (Cro superfamily)